MSVKIRVILDHVKEARLRYALINSLIFLMITACGGGGGGIGGGLIPGLMTLNTVGVMSGGTLQVTVNGGLAPYAFSMHTGLGATTTAPWGGVTISNSGLLTIPDIGDDMDIVIVRVIDDLDRKKYFRIPVLGKPKTWFMADKISAVDLNNGTVQTLVDQSGNLNDGTADCVADECPLLIPSDSALNNYSSIVFDGTNDFIQFANNVTGDITIALVYRSTSGGGAGGWAANSGIIQNAEYGVSLNGAGTITAGTNTGTNREFATAAGLDDNAPHIVLITKGVDSRVYLDSLGVGGNQVSGGVKSAGGLVYLGSDGAVNNFQGAVPEIMIYQRDLGGTVPAISDDRVILIRYLKEKYGVSLPAVPPPTVTITSAEPFDTDGLYSTQTTATFDYTYTASPYADIYRVECQLDGGAWSDCRNPDEFVDNHTKIYGPIGDALHTFIVKATDVDEKEATDTNSWTSDNTPPVCIISGTNPVDDLSDGWGNIAAFNIEYACTDLSPLAAGNPECSINGGGAWNPCTTTTTQAIAGLTTNDSTAFLVRATDSLGNGPGAEDTLTWQTDLEIPVCTITSAPSGVRMNASENIDFNCNDIAPATLLAEYKAQCSFDGGAYANCTSNAQHSLTSLAAGAHTLDIKVVDQSGLESIVQNATWTTDLIEPVCAFTVTPGTFGGLDPQIIEFSCSDDSDGAPTIDCSLDGGAYALCTTPTTFNVTNDTEGKVYNVDVRATDHAGRVSIIINTNWTCDLTDPVCSIDVGSSAGYDPPEFTNAASVYYDCSDSAGAMPMDRADCNLDGGGWATCNNTFTSGTGAKSGYHSMTGLAAGNHTLLVRGYDYAGRNHEISHSFRNDIGRPTCTIVTAISGDRNIANEAIDVQCDDDIALNDPAPENPQCILDDVTAGTVNFYTGDCGATAFGGTYNATATYNTAALTDGADYRLTVTITDSGGKTPGVDAVTTWTTDLTPPVCTITTSPDGLVHTWNFEDIAFTCDDASLDYTPQRTLLIECEIDGGGFSACDAFSYQGGSGDYQGTHQFPGLLVGDHTLKVRATDDFGNVSVESVGVTTADFNTDLADPVCSITAAPVATGVGHDNDNTPTFSYTCTDDNDTDRPRILTDYDCLLDDVVIGTGCDDMGTHTMAALAGDDQYKFNVRITDEAGKVSAVESLTWDYDGTKPTCSITSGQSGFLSNPNETFVFSCSDPVVNSIQSDISTTAQYECQLDAGGWVGCTAITNHNFVTADGAHTFYLQVTDDAGNLSNTYSISWDTDGTVPIVDTVGLSRPLCTFCDAGYSDNEASIEVTYTYTDVNPKNLCISEDSVIGNCAWGTDYTSPNSFALSAGDGVKTVYVWMRDDANNDSAPLTQTIELDKTVPNTPTVTVDAAATYATAVGVSVGFTSVDTNGNSRDVCHRLDTTVGSCGWTANVGSPDAFNLAAIVDGNQTVYSWIRDKAGNVSAWGSDAIYLDRNDPVCSISTGGGYKTSTTVGITYGCTDTSSSGVATRQCKLDAGSWGACGTATTHSFVGLSQGAHTLRVRATDNAGRIATEDNIAITVDTVNPTISTISTARTSGTQRQINFTEADATSGVSTIQCSIDGGAYAGCTSPKVVTITVGAATTFRVQVTDNAGLVTTSALYTDNVLYNARSAAECVAAGGTSGYGSHNYCEFAGSTCAWAIVTSKYDAKTCNPLNAAAGTSSCSTNAISFYAAAPTCGYNDNDSWSWTSYGNPGGNLHDTGTLAILAGSTGAAAVCTKTSYTTPCDGWDFPSVVVDEPTDCVNPGRCCRNNCSANNSGRTCTATTVNTVRCQ